MKTALTILLSLLAFAACQSNGDPAPEPTDPDAPPRPGAAEESPDGMARMRLYQDLDNHTDRWMDARDKGNSLAAKSLAESVIRPIVDANRDEIARTLANPQAGRLRNVAARALGFSSEAAPVRPALVAVLSERSTFLVSNALVSLYLLGDPDTPLAPLVALLNHSDQDVRVNDTVALYAILRARRQRGPVPLTDEVKSASGHLLALVSSTGEDEFARAHAAAALGQIGDPMAADVLMNLLEDDSEAVRMRAAEGLGMLGREEAIPSLVNALGNAQAPNERTLMVAALAEIAKRQGFPVDAGALGTDPSNWQAWYAAVKRTAE